MGFKLSTCEQQWYLRTRVQWNLENLGFLGQRDLCQLSIVVRATDTNGNFIDRIFQFLLDDGQEDTDGDGFLDSIEISSGSNERNASSVPADLPACKATCGWTRQM